MESAFTSSSPALEGFRVVIHADAHGLEGLASEIGLEVGPGGVSLKS